MEGYTHVATGEVSTLEHELGNHTVELGALVAEALLAGAESTEVLNGLRDNIVEKLEVDAALLFYRDKRRQQLNGRDELRAPKLSVMDPR